MVAWLWPSLCLGWLGFLPLLATLPSTCPALIPYEVALPFLFPQVFLTAPCPELATALSLLLDP